MYVLLYVMCLKGGAFLSSWGRGRTAGRLCRRSIPYSALSAAFGFVIVSLKGIAAPAGGLVLAIGDRFPGGGCLNVFGEVSGQDFH